MTHDFKGRVVVTKEIYYQEGKNYGTYATRVSQIKSMSHTAEQELNLSIGKSVKIAGNTARLPAGEECYLVADYKHHPKYGKQLEISTIARVVETMPTDYYSKRKVLTELFTEKEVENMYEAFPDPYNVFLNGEPTQLTKIKGCGYRKAALWLERFNSFIPNTQVFLGLEEFELSTNTIKKLLKQYKNPDLIIQKIKENPYTLCDTEGIGWTKADQAALASGMSPSALPRIESFIIEDLKKLVRDSGATFMYSTDLTKHMKETLGQLPKMAIAEAIQDMQDRNVIHWDVECRVIALQQYWRLENRIADEVLRLLDSAPLPFNSDPDRIRYIIHKEEQIQGWTYTEEQLEGLKTVLENNFVIITGSAGTGKSSLVNLILQVFSDRNYQIAQTALSGRAAARLTEVTHQPGSTIHRLLGYPKGAVAYHGFLMNQDCQLAERLIVVDEFSMIGGYLFYYLLRAIHTGAKVILLGDTGQLPPIGECNVAYDLLESGLIPTVTLNQIQRQAMTSAIVTESNKVRHGIQLFNERNVAGVFVRGEQKDLIIDCYSDKHNTFAKTIQYFAECLEEDPDILNTQVLAPMKVKGDSCNAQLNIAIQDLYNPDNVETGITIHKSSKEIYSIRVGDKVMNTHNLYEVPLAHNEEKTVAVFNGNVGIVLETDPVHEYAIIDFGEIGTVLMDGEALQDVQLSYACTVHKYQGSECDNIIVALDTNCWGMLSRELLYTAMTRAKKKCILVVQNSALCQAIQHSEKMSKDTFLTGLLLSKAAPSEQEEPIF